jgi:uncharacterized protein
MHQSAPPQSAPTPEIVSVPVSRSKPYWIGIGLGILSWLVFAIVAQPLGITTALSEVSGAVTGLVTGPEFVKSNTYWAKTIPALDYGTLFLVGTMIGGFIGALTSNGFKIEWTPQIWTEHFGSSRPKQMIAALAGGFLTMYGARLAGGCTSGNGISGGLQLAVSGWTFLAVMFASGLATAAFLFRRS